MNEESVGNVMAYFSELKAQKSNRDAQGLGYRQSNMGYTESQGHVINVNGAGDRSAKSGLSFNQNMINEQVLLHQQRQSSMGLSGMQADPMNMDNSHR
jgi:hypothetical protein